MSSDRGDDTESSGKTSLDDGLSLTTNHKPSVNEEWDAVAFEWPTDPRLVAFVVAFACWLADRDYDRLVNEGKQPWNENEDVND